jgi:polyphosphate kinase
VRMSQLKKSLLEKNVHSKDARALLIENLIARSKTFNDEQYNTFVKLREELKKNNIAFSEIDELDQAQKNWITRYFDDNIYPVLTPLAVDPAHPFPWISSKSVNLAIILREQKTDIQRFARIKVPTNLERLVLLPNTNTFIPIEKIIISQWEKLFLGMDIESYFVFRVTRSSNYEIDDSDDLLQAMSNVVRKRQRFGEATRLEIEAGIDNSWIDLIQNEVTLDASRIFTFPINTICDLSTLRKIATIDAPTLKYPPFKSKIPARLKKNKNIRTNLFDIMDDRDLLIHRPYESYEETVQALLAQCARDENVLAIKQTLYRAAGIDSPIVQSLCRAAQEGKQVVALVELKARFD